MKIIEDQPYLAMTVVIDKLEHLERYQVWKFDPYHYCLQCLVERYVIWLKRNKMKGGVIIESRFKKVDKSLKAAFLKLWAKGTTPMSPEILQRYLISKEIGLYPKAANIAGLQLCDLLAHPSAREMRRVRDGLPAYVDFGAEIVERLIASKYARNPKTRVIDGWGTKWLP